MNKMSYYRQTQMLQKRKKNFQCNHLQLSAQVKDVLSQYNLKGTWKSKSGKMGRTVTDTVGKQNLMTEKDIDKLFEQKKQVSSRNPTQCFPVEDNDFITKVHFLNLDDNFDKLLTGLPQQIFLETHKSSILPFDKREDLTAIFKKKYMVGKIIGEGAYASVRIAIDKKISKKIAIKVYQKHKIKDIQRKKSIRREIRILQKLNHPNIVRIIDVIETNNHLNIVMEYLQGLSLGKYLKDQPTGKISEKQCQSIFKCLTEALLYMHSQNIAHRDIKLENIILNEGIEPKFIDFGFSTCIEKGKKIKIFCGTPSYMAPEVVQRKEYRGETADIWALGVLLFVSLTGIFPFKGSTDQELYDKINSATYPKLEIMFSQGASDLISRMLTISPSLRITAAQILSHPWITGKNLMISTLTTKTKNIKQKSNQNRKRICTVQSITCINDNKLLLKEYKKGLAETYNQNLRLQIRKALKSPKNIEQNQTSRKIRTNKQNITTTKGQKQRKTTQQIKGNKIEKKGNSKIIELLRCEMKRKVEVENMMKRNDGIKKV